VSSPVTESYNAVYVPEEVEGGLEDSGEEGGSEGELQIQVGWLSSPATRWASARQQGHVSLLVANRSAAAQSWNLIAIQQY
jgi:hypothetical protein